MSNLVPSTGERRLVQMKAILGSCAVGALCAACATPAPMTVPTESPAAFEQQPPGQPAWPDTQWYHGFASEELDSLVAMARENNLDLAVATSRIRQADARARAAGA